MIGEVDARRTPFPHTSCACAILAPRADDVLRWMRSEAPWRLKVASFYEQWELPIDGASLPGDLKYLRERGFVEGLRDRMIGPLTDIRADLVEITAHRLVEGQTIRIHNDYLEGQETHRLLVQLNDGWSDENGGMLMIFGSASSRDLRRVVRPLHGSAFAFEISPGSYHAVSTVHGGERFTLVYSFKAQERGP